jgi:HK97 family phage prohead protease
MKIDRAQGVLRTFACPLEIRGIDEGKRQVEAWVSTETVDSYDEIVLATGIDLERYRKNPVVLWMHDMRVPAVGKAVALEVVEGRGLAATTQFAGHQLANDVWELYRDGFMRAFSIGFYYKWENDEPGWRYDKDRGVFVAWNTELLEYSTVTIPANPDALVKAAHDGHDAAERVLRAYYPSALQSSEERAAEDVKRAMGALTSLRNFARHCRRSGVEFPVSADTLAEHTAALEEILGRSLAEPAADPPPPSEPNPTDGALSAADLRGITERLDGLKPAVEAAGEKLVQALVGQLAQRLGK